MYLYLVKFYGVEARNFDIRKGHSLPHPLLIDEIEASSRNVAEDTAQLRGERIPFAKHYTLDCKGRVHARK